MKASVSLRSGVRPSSRNATIVELDGNSYPFGAIPSADLRQVDFVFDSVGIRGLEQKTDELSEAVSGHSV